MQYLYLIKCQQYYKIGVASDVERRFAELSTGNPFSMEVIVVYEFDNAKRVENTIHTMFSRVRWRGEWFSFSRSDIAKLDSVCVVMGGKKKNVEIKTIKRKYTPDKNLSLGIGVRTRKGIEYPNLDGVPVDTILEAGAIPQEAEAE